MNLSSPSLDSTSAHPPTTHHDATTAQDTRQPPANSSSTSQLSGLTIKLHGALRQFPDFPTPGVLFEDILPLFQNHTLHQDLITAFELFIAQTFAPGQKPDVIVGLESRGFLFGPTLAYRMGAGFVPVRKRGKLPGPFIEAAYEKEYGQDFFQIQKDVIKPGQQVLIVDDIIATGGSAAAAGSLVEKSGGVLLGYIFILELDFLKGRSKLSAPVHTLLSSQEGPLSNKS